MFSLSRKSDRAVMVVTWQRNVAIELLPSVISLSAVAEDAVDPFPITVLFVPVVILVPAV